jgi:aspartyl-tRNA(Asn)/glutamyl-tRNA(Gln) amidotransferase subunit A
VADGGRTVAEAAMAIAAGELTCVEATRETIARARHIDARLHCFVELDEDGALERAAALDDADLVLRLSPLFGVPFAHKDVFATPRRAPSAGARDVALPLRERNSVVLDRLRADGAISLGALNLDQFGYAATGTNPDFGDVRNPWDPTRVAGGSSSGAAAAVAAGAVPFAVGSDTGGSVRIPASYCGVVGLKPTLGRIPKRGSVPMSYSQDTIGILGRSVTDAALVLDATAGHDALDPSSFDVPVPAFQRALEQETGALDGLRVGLDRHYLRAAADDEVHAAAERALGVLAGLGAEIVGVDLALLAHCETAATVLTWAEVGAVHGSTFARRRDAYAAPVRARLDAALLSHGADHVDAMRYQGHALRLFCERVLSRADIIVTVSAARSPGTVEAVREAEEAGLPVSLEALRLTRPFNFLGLPAMSVPMGFAADGLPMGLQLVARPWAEARLLACGAAYQRVTDWHRRRPPIATTPSKATP